MNRLPAALFASLLAFSCAEEPPGSPASLDDGANPNPLCHPLAPAGAETSCALPYPSSFYLSPARTVTGYRVSMPEGALPKNRLGEAFSPVRLATLDGFSPATPLLVDLSARVDPAQLIPVDGDPAPTLLSEAPVQILAYDSGERVPLFAEVDDNVNQPGAEPDARQVLIIRPLVRLKEKTRYVVALRGLRDKAGRAISLRPFQALVAGNLHAASRLAKLAPSYGEIFALLEKQGVPRQSLTLAWDFTTGSDERIQGNLLQMRNVALSRWEKEGLGVTLSKVEELPGDARLLRRIKGTFSVPSFLTDPTDPGAGLKLDDDGRPVDSGKNHEADLLILVPRCAEKATTPLRAVIYGHGLLGGAGEIESGQHRRISQAVCIIEMATSFIGLSSGDVPTLTGKVFTRFDNLSIITDRLQQAQLNFVLLARLARTKLPMLAALTIEGTEAGTALLDGKQVYYMGGSQGGIYGNTIVSLSPDLSRGILVVGGGNYSMMLPRSTNFPKFKALLDTSYPDLVAQQLLLALSQAYWDFSDPISFARRNLVDPFRGPDGMPMAKKHILLQESTDDAQVPNVATRTIARTMGLAQMKPPVEAVFGLQAQDGPLDSAYVQFDTKLGPPPSRTNVAGTKDNGAHGSLGNIPQVLQQFDAFLREGGQVQNTCGQSCVFPQ